MNQSELIVAHIFMAVFRTICTLVQPWGPILILILIELELNLCLFPLGASGEPLQPACSRFRCLGFGAVDVCAPAAARVCVGLAEAGTTHITMAGQGKRFQTCAAACTVPVPYMQGTAHPPNTHTWALPRPALLL